MGEQAKQDLELLRKARNEVQKLEEIHARIMREEQEIEKYKRKIKEGVQCEQRPTNKAEEEKKRYLKMNGEKHNDEQVQPIKCLLGMLIALIVVLFLLTILNLVEIHDSVVWFWIGDIIVLGILCCIPFSFCDFFVEKGGKK